LENRPTLNFLSFRVSTFVHLSPIHDSSKFRGFTPSYGGLWLEFGVKAGGSIVYPAVLHRSKTIHGFDSFQGLPDSEFAANTPWKKGYST